MESTTNIHLQAAHQAHRVVSVVVMEVLKRAIIIEGVQWTMEEGEERRKQDQRNKKRKRRKRRIEEGEKEDRMAIMQVEVLALAFEATKCLVKKS